MPRLLPSQVVEVIDRIFPPAAKQSLGATWIIGREHEKDVAAIIYLVEQIPQELIALPSGPYTEFAASLAAFRQVLDTWHSRDQGIQRLDGFEDLNPMTLLRRALAQCPDEAPSPGIAGLTFIPDADLRENLRLEISEAYRDYANGNWKAATVMAGSTVEALLLWALQQKASGDITTAVTKLVSTGVLGANPGGNLEKWNLHEFIEVSKELGIIKEPTATQCKLTQDFRNLIHPGRATRLGMVCDRGTALSALAAVEHTIRDLTPP